MPRRPNETARSWWKRMPLKSLRENVNVARRDAEYEFSAGLPNARWLWGKYKAMERVLARRATHSVRPSSPEER